MSPSQVVADLKTTLTELQLAITAYTLVGLWLARRLPGGPLLAEEGEDEGVPAALAAAGAAAA